MATFANCRLSGDSQKYITVWYTKDAAPILDTLNEPEYQCNHPPGTHAAIAGGRDAYGQWLSTDTAFYKPEFCTKLAMAYTYARTGDPSPLSRRRQPQVQTIEPKGTHVPSTLPDVAPSRHVDEASADRANPEVTPRKLSFQSTPAGAQPPSPIRSSSAVNLGGGFATSPHSLPRQDARSREVRTSIREARAARARPDTIHEVDESADAPYISFTGTPIALDSVSASDMEATVASLVYDCRADDIIEGASNITGWIDYHGDVPDDALQASQGAMVFEATVDQITSMIAHGGLDTHRSGFFL